MTNKLAFGLKKVLTQVSNHVRMFKNSGTRANWSRAGNRDSLFTIKGYHY